MKYTLKRSRKNKKIYLHVREGVVFVSAPFYASIETIDSFVRENEDWIHEQLEKNSKIVSGDKILFLNHLVSVTFWEQFECKWVDSTLYLSTDPIQIQKFLILYFQRYMNKRFLFFSSQVGVYGYHLKYGFYKSKWGSCTPGKKRICFNVNLIFMPFDFIDAIILHELAHVYYPNHGKDFYRLLCTWMPTYKQVMKKNKKVQIPRLY